MCKYQRVLLLGANFFKNDLRTYTKAQPRISGGSKNRQTSSTHYILCRHGIYSVHTTVGAVYMAW